MAHVEFLINQPDVRLNTDAASLDSREEGNGSPIIVVRVACYRYDIPCSICRPMCQTFGVIPGLFQFLREEREDDPAY